jgi:hypothetical protein
VTCDPTDIGGTPVYLIAMIVKYIAMGDGGVEQIASGGMQNPLGLARRSRGIKNKERILGIHHLRLTVIALIHDSLVIPDVTTLDPANRIARASDDQYIFN